MTLDIFREKGTPLERQVLEWRDLAPPPWSKLDDDAFTRMRSALARAVESESVRFQRSAARTNGALRGLLAEVRRVELQQALALGALAPPDLDLVERLLGLEQLAIEVTASVAQNEPDAGLRRVLAFGLVEDVDHLYRLAALDDRLFGRDPNAILQSYTDIVPGRPCSGCHRHPRDDLRRPYDRRRAAALSKIHVRVVLAIHEEARAHYALGAASMADPLGRQLLAELASLEEQHVTQYESLLDPDEPWLEQWLLNEATEVWTYWSCASTEPEPSARKLYERFLSFELGQLHAVMQRVEAEGLGDPHELLPPTLPTPIAFDGQRSFVREVLAWGADLRADGDRFVRAEEEPRRSIDRRDALNASGSPSEAVAAGYRYTTCGELSMIPPAAAADIAPTVVLERVLEEPPRARSERVLTQVRDTIPMPPVGERAERHLRLAKGGRS